MQTSTETQPSSGPVELREDVPLKGTGSGGGGCSWAGGGAGTAPRGLACVFAALAAGITLALLAQLRWGGGTLGAARHGAAAAGAAACSRAGTELLRTARGSALDAAAAAALCLAVRSPHRTSLDASGSLVLWQYRRAPRGTPLLAEWGGAGAAAADAGAGAPRLVCAMWALRAYGSQATWHDVMQPAVELARDGFEVTEELVASVASAGVAAPAWLAPAALSATPSLIRLPLLASYLQEMQNFTREEMNKLCGNSSALVRLSAAAGGRAAGWRVWGAARGAAALLRALAASVLPPQTALPLPGRSPVPAEVDAMDAAIYRAALTLQDPDGSDTDKNAYGVSASGLAVIDPDDTYVALVTGLSQPFGSGSDGGTDGGADTGASNEWVRDSPHAPLDLAPAIFAEEHICGARYVAGAESSAALAQAGAALAAGGGGGVERARLAGPARGEAGGRSAARLPPAPLPPRAPPLAAVNLVLQRGDALTSHADSRAGGLASRF